MQKRYGVLRFVSGFYKVVGIIMGVLTLLSALGICATSVLGMSGFDQTLQSLGLPGRGRRGERDRGRYHHRAGDNPLRGALSARDLCDRRIDLLDDQHGGEHAHLSYPAAE